MKKPRLTRGFFTLEILLESRYRKLENHIAKIKLYV